MNQIPVIYDTVTKSFRKLNPETPSVVKEKDTRLRYWVIDLTGHLSYHDQLYFCGADVGFFNKERTKVYFAAPKSIHVATRCISEVDTHEFHKVVFGPGIGAIYDRSRIIQDNPYNQRLVVTR